jgi:hypothetical protein
MKMTRFVTVVCLSLTGAPAVPPVVCEPPLPLCEAAARADVVFLGEVLEETTYVEYTRKGKVPGPLPQGIQAVQFNITQAFKAVQPTAWWGLFYYGVDAQPFTPGARYLVFAQRRATGAFVTGCTRTREIGRMENEAALRAETVSLDACLSIRKSPAGM